MIALSFKIDIFFSSFPKVSVIYRGPTPFNRIPNYRLKNCYDAVPALQGKAPLTIVKSLSCIRLKMWDEERQKMVAFP
jgi:hypothetical protein